MIFNAETLTDWSKRRAPTYAGNLHSTVFPQALFSVIVIKYEVLEDLEKLVSGGLRIEFLLRLAQSGSFSSEVTQMRDSGTHEQRYDMFQVVCDCYPYQQL
jgi:hypothetical protein